MDFTEVLQKQPLVYFGKEKKVKIQPVNNLLRDRESRMLADNFLRNHDM